MNFEGQNVNPLVLARIDTGLYIGTCRKDGKDNAYLINKVIVISEEPYRVAVTIKKTNYSYGIVTTTRELNLNVVKRGTEPEFVKKFSGKSGKDEDKLAGMKYSRSENGLVVLDDYINALISLKVVEIVDFDTHALLICRVEENRLLNDERTMTLGDYFATGNF